MKKFFLVCVLSIIQTEINCHEHEMEKRSVMKRDETECEVSTTCKPGWSGDSCEMPCPRGKYGMHCKHKCQCQNEALCDSITGECTCTADWEGPTCDTRIQCPSDWETHMNDCFLVRTQKAFWNDSEAFCVSAGGHLAYITSSKEDSFLQELIKNSGFQEAFWLGGYDKGNDDGWAWSSRYLMIYTNWLPGEPNHKGYEKCMTYATKGGSAYGWNNVHCRNRLRSICKIHIGP